MEGWTGKYDFVRMEERKRRRRRKLEECGRSCCLSIMHGRGNTGVGVTWVTGRCYCWGGEVKGVGESDRDDWGGGGVINHNNR